MSATGAAVVAIVVAVIAAVSTPAGLWLSSRQRSREKVEDWARQDLVADRAVAAAAEATAAAVVKLDDIQRVGVATHALVDGNLTKAMQSELAAHVLAVTMMVRDIDATVAAGRQPNPDLLASLQSSRTLIEELQPIITDRVEQAKIADAATTHETGPR